LSQISEPCTRPTPPTRLIRALIGPRKLFMILTLTSSPPPRPNRHTNLGHSRVWFPALDAATRRWNPGFWFLIHKFIQFSFCISSSSLNPTPPVAADLYRDTFVILPPHAPAHPFVAGGRGSSFRAIPWRTTPRYSAVADFAPPDLHPSFLKLFYLKIH
jgi:hypothetical protein